ncbi:MAG: hypothetical protein US54_C0071G0002 [Candidatus Roizmanbacteria bacterium GW2011_GWA2_37_7]|uniref:Uncharacterized protein n=1 Tax=Candidatus Roizmanbacteria bacterium GW2011_GWA2_37_7 TaxID=1618481 RepID=A0A0G0HCU3_9BACT|nr:MAG: hypothetical protein US54_C0071G0002 [Candidatus Roizmanbacteria bacterium GW2011_GWA2_37_7]
MVNFSNNIKKNREFFNFQKISITDQKTVDFSIQNTTLDEIIDLIIWSSNYFKHKK